ncbi:MAG: hypothetical protein AMXMBFR47_27750 [Planctomycetota bacterium]
MNPTRPLRDFPQWLLTLTLLAALASAAAASDRENCLFCHQFPGLSRFDPATERVRLFYVDPAYAHHGLGPHARLNCTDCHNREEVRVVPHATVTPVDCTRTCHLSRPDSPPREFSHAPVARALEESVHTAAELAKVRLSGGPLLQPGQSACLNCHDEPVFRSEVHHRALADMNVNRCDTCHAVSVPLETDFFARHVTSRLQPARPALEMAQVCAVCHSDPVFKADREIADPVASYVRSFHGKAALLGGDTASCVDCHVGPHGSAHNFLRADNPNSTVHATRIADSCRSTDCHPGADKSIAATAVHLDIPTAIGSLEFFVAMAFIFLTLFAFGPSAMIVLLELFHLVVGKHTHGAKEIEELADELNDSRAGRRRLRRFTPFQRVQHWTLTVLFLLLIITGFPMKFADSAWAASLIAAMGGLGVAREIHHVAGTALIAGFLMHMGYILYTLLRSARQPEADGRRRGVIGAALGLPMVLTRTDMQNAGSLFGYLLGLKKDRPRFGRFSVLEKLDYVGVLWGTTVLGVTGLMLWAEQTTSHFMNGRVFNIATIIHTYEAFLAMIHVGILHMYAVVLSPTVFPLSPAMLSGRTPSAKLAEENAAWVLDAAASMPGAASTKSGEDFSV